MSIQARPMAGRRVPVALLQEQFFRLEPAVPSPNGGIAPRDAANTLAERLGWYSHRGCPDGPRVRRALGLRPYTDWTGRWRIRSHVNYRTAVLLLDAMGVAPHEVDL